MAIWMQILFAFAMLSSVLSSSPRGGVAEFAMLVFIPCTVIFVVALAWRGIERPVV
jgi:hypothetical protein